MGDVLEALIKLECSKGARTTSVDHSFGDAFMIKAHNLTFG